MDKKIIISSLALDLRRIAQGSHRGSLTSVAVFKKEALERGKELENIAPDQYLKKIWLKVKRLLESDDEGLAEDALMYSTLFQNFAVYKCP